MIKIESRQGQDCVFYFIFVVSYANERQQTCVPHACTGTCEHTVGKTSGEL
jgi:hypothetical protein